MFPQRVAGPGTFGGKSLIMQHIEGAKRLKGFLGDFTKVNGHFPSFQNLLICDIELTKDVMNKLLSKKGCILLVSKCGKPVTFIDYLADCVPLSAC